MTSAQSKASRASAQGNTAAGTEASPLGKLLESHRLVVCVGSGGVGKTTAAAALGLHAAIHGKRVLVITIDPARRLANALGLESIGNRETEIPPSVFQLGGIECRGTLHAMMLDTRTTFDDLIGRVAPDQATRDRILSNKIYQQISNAISTAQDVMATEKLHDVYHRGEYDLIVLDTPPMKNALDFLEAPNRMTRFLDEKIIKWFLKPLENEKQSLTSRLMMSTGAMAYKLLGFIFGNEFLSDLNEFFVNFKDMTRGFRERSEEVARILHSDGTSFLIVCSPGRTSVEDARHFAAQLRERKLPAGGIIINQVRSAVQVPFDAHRVLSPDEIEVLKSVRPDIDSSSNTASGAGPSVLARMEQFYRWNYVRSIQDQRAIAELRRLITGSSIFRVVPRMVDDINDIPGLLRLGKHLFAST